jgi:hypothetical protein
MNHNPCRIDDPAKPGPNLMLDLLLDHWIDVLKREDGIIDFGKVLSQEFFTEVSQSLPDSIHHNRPAMDL